MDCVSHRTNLFPVLPVSMKDAFVLINWYKDILPLVCYILICTTLY